MNQDDYNHHVYSQLNDLGNQVHDLDLRVVGNFKKVLDEIHSLKEGLEIKNKHIESKLANIYKVLGGVALVVAGAVVDLIARHFS